MGFLVGFLLLGIVEYFNVKAPLDDLLKYASVKLPVVYTTGDYLNGLHWTYTKSVGYILNSGDSICNYMKIGRAHV